MTKQGTLTNWRWQREGQVRTRKESNQARHTHRLEMAEGGTSQDTETKRPSNVHSLPGDGRGRDKSGHRNKATKQGCTHELEMGEGGTSQDTERKQPSKAHSLPGDGRGRDKSGQGKKATKRGTLTGWRQQREGHKEKGG